MWIGTTTVSSFRRRASSGDSPQTIFFGRLDLDCSRTKSWTLRIPLWPQKDPRPPRPRHHHGHRVAVSAMLRRGRDRGRRVPPFGRPVLRPARVRARVHRRVLAPVRGPSADARSAHLARFRDVRGGRVRVRKHRVQLRDVRAHGPGVAHAAGRAGDVRGGGRGGPAVVRQVPVPETRPDAPLLRLQAVRPAHGPPLPVHRQLRRRRQHRYFFNFLFWLWCGCMVTVWHTRGSRSAARDPSSRWRASAERDTRGASFSRRRVVVVIIRADATTRGRESRHRRVAATATRSRCTAGAGVTCMGDWAESLKG